MYCVIDTDYRVSQGGLGSGVHHGDYPMMEIYRRRMKDKGLQVVNKNSPGFIESRSHSIRMPYGYGD